MTSLSMHNKGEKFVRAMGPWFYGIPAFLIVGIGLLWSLTRLANWVFAVLKAAK
ncbi:MAG TPA: hypothetical protein VK210_08425 [Terriglobia bacterium]|nr:hypothetical protein [Terriglobia bacterium]